MKTFIIIMGICYSILSTAFLGKEYYVFATVNYVVSACYFLLFIFRGSLEYERNELKKEIDIFNKNYGTNHTIESLLGHE